MSAICQARVLRLRYGITLAELARAAGVSSQLISAMELEVWRQSRLHEAMLRRAFHGVISHRRGQLEALEQELGQTGFLLAPAEEGAHGI